MSPHQVFTLAPMDCPVKAYEKMSIVRYEAPVPANLQFAGAEYGDLQPLSMTVTLMATCSFSAANIVFFSEKQGKNMYFRITKARAARFWLF